MESIRFRGQRFPSDRNKGDSKLLVITCLLLVRVLVCRSCCIVVRWDVKRSNVVLPTFTTLWCWSRASPRDMSRLEASVAKSHLPHLIRPLVHSHIQKFRAQLWLMVSCTKTTFPTWYSVCLKFRSSLFLESSLLSSCCGCCYLDWVLFLSWPC